LEGKMTVDFSIEELELITSSVLDRKISLQRQAVEYEMEKDLKDTLLDFSLPFCEKLHQKLIILQDQAAKKDETKTVRT
jgi:hypothetical protein